MGLRESGLVGPAHAMATGEVFTALRMANFDVRPIMARTREAGEYTKEIEFTTISGTYRVTVEPVHVREL